VGRRWVNNADYQEVTEIKDFIPASQADMNINQDKSYYRVFNTTKDVFNDNSPGYFHYNAGGYSAAKLYRYQDLIEKHLSQNSVSVFNMLNIKYFIGGENGKEVPQQNPGACGNAWFVNKVLWAKNADDEMDQMKSFNSATDVVIDERQKEYVKSIFSNDSSKLSATISLSQYHPDHMKYEVQGNDQNRFAVFSEIWYRGNEDWKAYIDGKEAKMIRVNYLLRGLDIPAGAKLVEFKFRPASYYNGNLYGYLASLLLLAVMGYFIFDLYRQNKNTSTIST
jgi:hypothetical protein